MLQTRGKPVMPFLWYATVNRQRSIEHSVEPGSTFFLQKPITNRLPAPAGEGPVIVTSIIFNGYDYLAKL
jgi:hypothetical protein